MDHMIPVSRGGFHTIANIVPACQPCNSTKHDKNLAEFLLYGGV
jgi:5-methylcytosine-specific restriction endonuclease McrA